MDLRKASIHPYLFAELDTEPDDLGEHIVKNSGKFLILDRLIQRIVVASKQKVLIFSQFTMVLNIVEDFLNWRGLGYFRLDGSTVLEDRIKFMDEFNDIKQKKQNIFILSTRAGGLGINLIAATNVIILDSDWNPQMDMQAMDRAHRIGQKFPVTVYRLITKKTIEERIIERQTMKIKLDYLIIERGRKFNKDLNLDFDINQLNEQELKDLAYFGANDILNLPDEDLDSIDIDKLLDEGERIAEEKNAFLEQKLMQFQEQATNFEVSTHDLRIYEDDNYRDQRQKDFEAVRDLLLKNMQQQIGKDQLKPSRREVYSNRQTLIFKPQTKKLQINSLLTDAEIDRLYELEILKEKVEFKAANPQANFENEDLTFDDHHLKEIQKLQGQLFKVSRQDFDKFIKGMQIYGRHNLEAINKQLLQDWSEEHVYKYALLFWKKIDGYSDGLKLLNKIEKGEYDRFKGMFQCRLIKRLFQHYKSEEDILLPVDLHCHLVHTWPNHD